MAVKTRIAILAACSVLALEAGTLEAQAKGAFETFGDVGEFAVPLAAAAVSAWKVDLEGLAQLGVTTAVATGATYGLKEVVDRHGPDGEERSFPSGHATVAFAGASYLHYRYGWQYGLPAYAVAAAVAASRVTSHHHWATDVIAGAALANLTAYLVTDKFDDRVTILPVVDREDGFYGVSVAFRV